MFRLDPELKVYLHREAVDFRKNINGLATLVEQSLGLDPFARAVYVFRNRRADRIKLLGPQRLLAAAQAAGTGPLQLAARGGGRNADGRAAALAARGH